MDMVAFLGAFGGVTLATYGYSVVGGALLLGSLVVFATSLVRIQKPPLLLPFSFGSWFIALPLGFLATYVFRSPLFLGLALYYYGCIALVERQARYVPWGAGLGLHWQTATRVERPLVYWLLVGLFFALSGILLVAALLGAAGDAIPNEG